MSSNGKSTTGYGGRFQPKPKSKEVPHAGLHMLTPNGSNVTVWKEALYAYAEANHHSVGRAFADGKRLVRTKPTLALLSQEYSELHEDQLQVMLQQEISQLIKLKRKDEDDESSLFALIGQVTSDEGLARVKSLAEYAAVADSRNADGLLKLVISEHTLMMHHTSARESKYVAVVRYMRNKQLPQQSDEDYVEKFKLARGNMKTLNCKFDPDDDDDALQFLMNMDPERHGEFMRELINRERAEAGKGIPNTVQGVMEAARRFISTPKKASQVSSSLVYAANNTVKSDTQEKTGAKACGNCKTVGHFARDCKEPCANCKKTGHLTRHCPDPPNTEKRVMVVDTADKSEDGATDNYQDVFGYNFNMRVVQAYNSMQNNKRVFAIDSFASESFVFCEDLLTGCSDDKTTVFGIHGAGTVGRRGFLPALGPAIVSPNGGVNGISLMQLEQRFKVTYEQQVAFTVDIGDGDKLIFNFDAKSGSYLCMFDDDVMCKLTEIATRSKYIMISTVAEREARFSKREVARAGLAREMMRKMYHPSDAALVRTINHGVLTNCDVTGKDVVIATDIWGRDVASIKGKTKDYGPVEDRRMFVPIMERKEQTVYADVFHWRKISFLLFIVKPLKLLLLQWLPKPNLKGTIIAVNALGNKLAARGFRVSELIVDPGKELTGLEGKVRYRINTVDSRTHVADAEVEIRTIKERMRCTEARLPYKLPRRCVRFLADGVVAAYNLTLRAGETVSPRELFTGVKADYSRDMKFEFGQYVQAHVAPSQMLKNGPTHRSVGAIALCTAGNDKGGWWFMSLKKKGFFNANRADALPMPDIVVDRLNQIADADAGVSQEEIETEIAEDLHDSHLPAGEDNDESEREQVGLPTVRDRVDPIDEERPLGTVTDNHMTLGQLMSDNESSGPVQDHGAGMDTLNNVVRVPDPTGTSEHQQEIVVVDNTMDLEPQEVEEHAAPIGMSATTEGEDNAPKTWVPRRSARIAARKNNILRMSSGDPQLERKVHSYRVKVAEALGQDNQRESRRYVRILRLTIKKAMEKNPGATVASVEKEFKQLIDKNVWTIVSKANLTKSQLRSSIRSSMFLKEKYNAAGVFDKLKARLVAGGDGQDRDLFDNLSCPTVTQETVMMVLAIAAVERRKLMTIDITGAYLECDLTEDMEVIMKLDPLLTRILQQVDKTAAGQQDEKGVTYVKLNKALYGTVQAALLWYKKLSGVLTGADFKANPYDPCLFNKEVNGTQITVCFHVDDLLVSCKSTRLLEALVKYLEDSFSNLTVNRGHIHSYLAMNIMEQDEHISVDMTAYIEKCIEGRVFGRAATSPARDDLFDEPEDSKALSGGDMARFHSSVAQLLYLCKRTRVESLCAVNHLSSRVAKSTEDDEVKLERVLNYLAHTKDRKVLMKKGGEVSMEAYIDASFGVHADGRSRTGIALMMCGICVGAWSSKQKLNTKSSTEAEIVGLSDGLSHVIWMRMLLMAQGHNLPPTKVHQDNQGVLSIMQQGRSPKHRTKHLNIRHFFARDRVQSGDITLVYCPTREMIADVLTKAVNGELFQHLVRML